MRTPRTLATTRWLIMPALLGALTITIPLIAAATTQAASGGTGGWFTVSGRVTGSSGPVHVWLYEWPSSAVVRSLQIGQKVPLTVLGEQTTTTGRYAFSVNPAALPGGIVNMEVAAFGRGGMTAASFTRQHVAGTMMLTALFGPAQMVPQVANMRLPASPGDTIVCPAGGTLHFQRDLGPRNVVVGATYSKASNFNTGFIYEDSQSSSLGVGLSAGASFGDFHEDGTYGQSSTALEPFPTYHGVAAHARITGFRYGLFRWLCNAAHGGSYWANYQSQVTDFAGGVSDPNTNPNIHPTFCRSFDAGGGVILKQYAAWRFGGGVNISAVLGINLSSQTGYDQGAQSINLVTKPGPARLICGIHNYPAGSHPPPGLVQGH